MLKIGVSSCFFYPDKTRKTFWKKQLCYAEKDFLQFWSAFGVMPILIPDLPHAELAKFVAQLDGVALHGGTDLNPSTYKEKALDAARWPGDLYRDNYELEVVAQAMKNNLPIFGVCRGAQLLNVYFGGTLYQDIPTEISQPIDHADLEKYDQFTHPISVVPGKLFDKLGIKNQVLVNSIHHQSVKRLGDDLEILATAPDGVIEAFQWTKRPPGFVLGVQWHPEFSKHAEETLFDNELLVNLFLKHCESRQKG